MSEVKFNINLLRDYFLKANITEGKAFSDLKSEELAGLAVLSIFDKKGQTVQESSYSYQKPDGIIDKSEFYAVTEKQYEKAAKDIKKSLEKATGRDLSRINIPSYSDMVKMMSDNKIDYNELIYPGKSGNEPLVEIKIPQKNDSLSMSQADMAEHLQKMNRNEVAAMHRRVQAGEKFDFSGFVGPFQDLIDEFQPETQEIAYNKEQLDKVEQYNSKDQVVSAYDGVKNVYRKYKYDGSSKKYSELMEYTPKGLKSAYYKRGVDGRMAIFSLDENEEITRITVLSPEDGMPIKDAQIEEFNQYRQYEKFMDYCLGIGLDEQTIDEELQHY